MNLIIDIGNSFTKVALFKNGELQVVKQLQEISSSYLEELCSEFFPIEKAILSSVKTVDSGVLSFLTNHIPDFVHLTEETPVPIKNSYTTPGTLGKDRLAAVVGASNIYPLQNVLVIDAGTALTFDVITKEKEYLGGNISPGLRMRFKSLHQFTGSLPLCRETDEFLLIGESTETAIISGVQSGMILEMDGYINRFKNQFSALEVILTGGDSDFFDKKLKSSIFVNQNLVLIGLNYILEFNVEQ
jgi:type III pantothenate kinase